MDIIVTRGALERERNRKKNEDKVSLSGCMGGGGGENGVSCDAVTYEGSMAMSDLCQFDRVATAAHSIAGQTSATIQIEPDNSPWFCPRAIAVKARDATDPQLQRVVLITSVNVQRCPQLDIDEQNPTAATLKYIMSTEWDPDARSGCACKVDWDCFSNLANSYPIRFVVFNPNPAGILVNVTFDVIGRRINTCVPVRKPGSRRDRHTGVTPTPEG